MLKRFKQSRLQTKLLQLTASGDLELWPRVRDELVPENLTDRLDGGASVLERCICGGHNKLLGEILHRFPQLTNAELSGGDTLARRAINADQAVALLTTLLLNGLDPNSQINDRSLVETVLEQPPARAMLLVNRLVQHGATLTNPALLRMAIEAGDTALIKFLADSGAPLEPLSVDTLNPELVAFSRRAIEDKKIRDMWA